jgi:O-antigen/teichoic acid export membrane protein
MWGSFATNGFVMPSGHVAIISSATALGGALNIVFDILLIEMFGFTGVFITTLVVHSFSIAITNVLFYVAILRKTRATTKD